MKTNEITIPIGHDLNLKGNLNVPVDAHSLVIFSHGSGSSRFSSRNNYVASILNKEKIATLLIDLLTEKEDEIYENRFNIDLIAERLVTVTNYIKKKPGLQKFRIGYFGASTGAASALKAAAQINESIQAVVSRGGRPDLAQEALAAVKTPTLLIVGGLDAHIVGLNRNAYKALTCKKNIEIIEGATHLFEEPGKLEEVAKLSTSWFTGHLHPILSQINESF